MEKKTLLSSLVVFTGAVLFFGCGPSENPGQSAGKKYASGNSAQTPDPTYIVAQVDNTPLTWGEMEKRAMGYMNDDIKVNHLMIPSNRMEEAKTFFRRRSINAFVFKTIMMNEAVRQKIQVTENDRAESYQSLAATLRQRNWTTNDFFSKGPLDSASMYKEFNDGIVIDKLLKVAVRNRLKITNDEVQDGMANIEKTNDLLRVKLEDVRKQLKNGADFEEIARNISQCPSAKNGGDLGEFTRCGRLPKTVEDQAFKQEVGEIGPVIRSTMGYHIIKVTAKMPAKAKTATTPEVPESIRVSQILLHAIPVNIKKVTDSIMKLKFDKAIKDFYKNLLSQASVECYIYKDMKFGEESR